MNPKESKEHQEYLDRFCNAFYDRMISLIDLSAKKQDKAQKLIKNDAFAQEILRHLSFAAELQKGFKGREEILSEIKNYVTERTTDGSPFILHGVSLFYTEKRP